MNKKFFAILTILVVVIGISSSLASAKNDKGAGDIPEKDGTYDVPGHPELKVRVFVHKANPNPVVSSTLICDLNDPNSLAIVDREVWKLPSTFTYNLNPYSVPGSVGGNNLPTITTNAFSQWANAIDGKVTVNRGSNTTINRKSFDGKNIITWGRISASALGITYIWYYPSSGLVAELDTIMNQKYFWTWSGDVSTCAYTNSYDAQSILTHELGH